MTRVLNKMQNMMKFSKMLLLAILMQKLRKQFSEFWRRRSLGFAWYVMSCTWIQERCYSVKSLLKPMLSFCALYVLITILTSILMNRRHKMITSAM